MSEAPWIEALTGVSVLRYLLLVLGLGWGLATARWGLRASLVAGVVFVETAVLFWILGLGRPYGLFADAEITRFLADLVTSAASPAFREGAVVGEAPSSPGIAYWLRLGLSVDALRWLPSWLPLVTAIAPALLVAALWRDTAAPLAAVLCLAFATGELDTLAGLGFWPGLWARPGASLVLVALLTVVVLVDRFVPLRLARTTACAGLVLGWIFVPASGEPRGLAATLLLLTFDQGLWLWPAAFGLVRGGRTLSRSLCLGGALLSLLSGTGLPVDAWGGHAFYRIGLLLAAATALDPLLTAAAPHVDALRARFSSLARLAPRSQPRSLAAAALLLATVPTSFFMQWNARRLDATYEASMRPLSEPVAAAMSWIRDHTDRDASFVVGPAYALAVATVGERRVLRAPGFPTPGGDRGRRRLEGGILHGRDVVDWVRMYRVRYVFVAPSDFVDKSLERPEDVGRAGLHLVYENHEGMRIYEVPVASSVDPLH